LFDFGIVTFEFGLKFVRSVFGCAVLLAQKLVLCAYLQRSVLQDGKCSRTLVGVGLDHPEQHVHEVLTLAGGQPVELATFDLLAQVELGVGLEGRAQVGQFVDHAACTPDVAFGVIGVAFVDFRSHVLGCAHVGLGLDTLFAQSARETKVAELDVLAPVDEEVARLQVAVQDLLGVDLVDGDQQLVEHLPDDLLGHELVGLSALLDQLGQVAVFTLLHHDLDLLVALVDDAVLVAHDLLVVQVAQDVHLVDQLLPLLLVHVLLTNFLPHLLLLVLLRLHFDHRAERAFPDRLDSFLII